MPVTYNFTIRAIDDAGAYADRSFSMTINNTSVYRFVAIGTECIKKSFDGITWDTDNGLPGYCAGYHNAWIAGGTAYNTMYRSIDAVSWTTFAPTITQGSGGAAVPSLWNLVEVQQFNGALYGFIKVPNTYGVFVKSTDGGLNWETLGSLTTYNHALAKLMRLAYNPNDGTMVCASGLDATTTTATGNQGIYTSTDGGLTWSSTLNSGNLVWGASVIYVNGVFVATTRGTLNSLYTSTDGLTWVNRISGFYPGYATYANGRLECLRIHSSHGIYTSVDAGVSWNLLSGSYTNQLAYAGVKNYAFSQGVWLIGNGDSLIYSTDPDLPVASWNPVAYNGIGSALNGSKYIATRN